MNKLVEYLVENYHPGGNAYKIVSTVELLQETELSVEELHNLILEANRNEMVLYSRTHVKGNRWSVDEMIPGDIDHVTVTRKGIKWHNSKI